MKREKGLAYCGLACCVCGENDVCTGCRSLGCKNFESCKHFDCCREKGYNGCWECADFPCGGMHDKVRVRAFVEYIKRNGEEKMLDCLERNEKAGITYHYQGQYEGDYDKCATVDDVIKMLEVRNMRTILKFDTHNALTLPTAFQSDDVRFSDSFAEFFIEQFTKPGDTVFDPFAGFGTTMYAAERLGRKAYGVEFLPERAAFIRENMKTPDGIIYGSSLALDEMDLPEIDFVLTSPPYMQKVNHPQYPFAGYEITGQGYDDYLSDIAKIFKSLKRKMKSDAYAVVEVSNLLIDGAFTPLAWDIAGSVETVLTFRQEMIIEWKNEASPAYGFGYDHSYALVFQNGGAA